MYVLTKDNFVFYGPNQWNPKLIQSYIEDDFELEMIIDQMAPESNTDLGNGITAYKIGEVQIPEYNTKIQRLEGPFYTFSDTATQSFTVVDKNIDFVKQDLLALVANARWEKEISGVEVTVQNTAVKVTTQRGDRDIFLQALQGGVDNTVWKLADTNNSTVWLTLSLADLQTIVNAIKQHIIDSFDWEKAKADEIAACQTLDELDKVEV